ncbi:MAG: glycosyltransferase [Acidimicrobiia bacterium]|nr:glycosyltransferase [Acidimicrobiia bacterium]
MSPVEEPGPRRPLGPRNLLGPPLVSVLLPVYDAATTLPACLSSLLGQTLDSWEIVAVDDGSTDGSADLLADAARLDARVRVLHEPHRGVVGAAAAGLAACRGRYVARMDADDVCAAHRLEAQVEMLEADPTLSVASSLVRVLDPPADRVGFLRYVDWVNSLVSAEEIAREIFVESPLPNPSTMVRRAELEALGGIRETGWPEDYELWLRYHNAARRMAKVDEVLLHWRDEPGRLTRTDPRYSVESFLRAKAHYLAIGPLAGRDPVIVWGAGKMGRRLSKHLLREGVAVRAFADIDPAKIGRTCRGLPVFDRDELPERWRAESPGRAAVLAAVGSRAARELIRAQLVAWSFVEGRDFWCAA